MDEQNINHRNTAYTNEYKRNGTGIELRDTDCLRCIIQVYAGSVFMCETLSQPMYHIAAYQLSQIYHWLIC